MNGRIASKARSSLRPRRADGLRPADDRPRVARVLAAHRGVEGEEGVHVLDREVAAVGHRHAGVEQRAPGVGAEEARRAEAVAGPVHVARLVHRLHARDHVERRDPVGIVTHRDGHPFVLTGGTVDTLCVAAVPVALSLGHSTGQRVFDDRFSRHHGADFDLSDLRCYGRDLSTEERLKQRITIRANDEELLELLVNEDVTVSLNSTVFTQDCVVPEEELDTTLEFPRSTSSCNSCGMHDDL